MRVKHLAGNKKKITNTSAQIKYLNVNNKELVELLMFGDMINRALESQDKCGAS